MRISWDANQTIGVPSSCLQTLRVEQCRSAGLFLWYNQDDDTSIEVL